MHYILYISVYRVEVIHIDPGSGIYLYCKSKKVSGNFSSVFAFEICIADAKTNNFQVSNVRNICFENISATVRVLFYYFTVCVRERNRVLFRVNVNKRIYLWKSKKKNIFALLIELKLIDSTLGVWCNELTYIKRIGSNHLSD